MACVLDYCFYRHEDKGAFNKSQNMTVFDVEDLLSNKNKGNQGISVSDSDLSKKSKEMGVEKERLKKALEDENEMARLLREIDEKLDYLIEHDYLEAEFLGKYNRKFVKKLMKETYKKKFRFRSFMSAFKFYKQYAMKTNDGQRYL